MSKLKVGIQLYSVRDDMEKDMDATLKAVADMGYDCVEFAGYFGKTAEEVKAMLNKYGLEAVSVHQGYDVFLEDEKANIDYLKTLGVKFCAIPWMDVKKHKGNDVYPKTVEEITKVAKALKAAGIQMCYHNHDFEFGKYEDKFLLDWLYEDIPADLLETEIDTCWVKYAGYDPCEYLKKYTGRVHIVHLKDFTCKSFAGGPVYALIDDNGKEGEKASKEDNGFMFKPVGSGIQDFPAIIDAAKAAGAEYIIVEQDQSDERPALEAAKMSRDYLKSIGY